MNLSMIDIIQFLKGSKLGTWYRKRVWNKRIVSLKVINDVISEMDANITPDDRRIVVADILDMAKRYRFSPEEYYCYHFKNKPEDERKRFISDLNRVDYCERVNLSKNQPIFDDKFRTYQTFRPYFNRDVCCVRTPKHKNSFMRFTELHSKFIVKPLSDSCGNGVRIVDLSQFADKDLAITELIAKYKHGGFIAEELILQSDSLGKFHPNSVNTVRLATVAYDSGVEILGAFFRTGRGNSVVDNAGAGGVFGYVDVLSGEILSASDKCGNSYTQHPDTLETIVGFKIPRWDEAVKLVTECASIVKGNRYAGWDLALSDKGWMLVEANARGQFLWQIPSQKGILSEINHSLRRLHFPEIKTAM